jgi:hypothetical protein
MWRKSPDRWNRLAHQSIYYLKRYVPLLKPEGIVKAPLLAGEETVLTVTSPFFGSAD